MRAPVAVLGYAMPVVRYPVDASPIVPRQGQTVVREDVTWSTDSGLTAVKASPQFVYATSNPLGLAPARRGESVTNFFVEQDGPTSYPVCGADYDSPGARHSGFVQSGLLLPARRGIRVV